MSTLLCTLIATHLKLVNMLKCDMLLVVKECVKGVLRLRREARISKIFERWKRKTTRKVHAQ